MNTHANDGAVAPELFEQHMLRLLEIAMERATPEEDDPLAQLAREFFSYNWEACRDGLLRRTDRIRVVPIPEADTAPRMFRWEIHTKYKSKLGRSDSVQLRSGPVRGQIIYRGDVFANPVGPCVAVLIDCNQGYFHPNHNRERGILCLGDLNDLPPGPILLDQLLAVHLYPIVTYQNRRPSHPADLEAAQYFALDPSAMDGLEPAAPLY